MAACQNCGADLPPGVSFCPGCGSRVSMEAGSAPVSQGASAQGAAIPPPPPPGTAPPIPGAAASSPAGAAPPPPVPPQGGVTTATPPPPMKPARSGMSRGLKVGLIIALILIVLIVAGVIVGVFAFVKVISAPADVANSYVKAVNTGNLDEAYSYLSAATKSSEGLAGFKSKLGAFKGNITKYNTSSVNVQSGGTATVVMDLSFSDGTKDTWTMGLVKENGKWKIQAVKPKSSS